MVARWAHNPNVVGSSPTSATTNTCPFMGLFLYGELIMKIVKFLLLFIICFSIFGCSGENNDRAVLNQSLVKKDINTDEGSAQKFIVDSVNKGNAPNIITVYNIIYDDDQIFKKEKFINIQAKLNTGIEEDYNTYINLYKFMIPILKNIKEQNKNIDIVNLHVLNKKDLKVLNVEFKTDNLKYINFNDDELNTANNIKKYSKSHGKLYTFYK